MTADATNRQLHWRDDRGGVTVGAFYAGRWIAYAEIVTVDTSLTMQRRMSDGNTLETAQAEAVKCGEKILKAA